jgi:hypothetical protein
MTPRSLTAQQVYHEVLIAESMLERVRAAIAWFDTEDPRLPLITQAASTVDELALEVCRLGVERELRAADGFPYLSGDGSAGRRAKPPGCNRAAGPSSGREAK